MSTSTTSAGSSCSAPATTSRAQRSRVRNGPHGRLVAHRQVGGGGVDRHPGAAQHPAQGGRAAAAAHDDGHPRPRHAVEQVRLAQPPGDVAGLLRRGAQQVGLDVAAVAAPAVTRRCAAPPTTPTCAATRAARRPAPRHRTGTRCDSSRVGASGQAVTNRRGSAPRKVWVAASGSPSSTRSTPPPATTTCSRRSAAGVSSWASSTTTSRRPGAQPVERLGVGLEVVGRGAEDPGRVERPGRRQRGHLVVLEQHVRRPRPTRAGRGPARGGRGPRGRGRARRPASAGRAAHRGRCGWAAPGAPTRATGGADRLARGVAGEQLAEDDVLLGAAQQPRGGVADQGRRLAQDAEAERLVGAGQRGGRGATEPGGDGVAQPGGREPGRGEQEAAVGRGLAAPRPAGPRPRRRRWTGRCPGRRAPAAPGRGARRPRAGSRRAPARWARRWRDDEGRAPRDSTTPPRHRAQPPGPEIDQ